MKKDEFNKKFREYAKIISPQPSDRDLVEKIYASFNDLFGVNNCIQIGSYPRYTAISPIHDLDILYILGTWDEKTHDPSIALKDLALKIKSEYKNPTSFTIEISAQTHSITISYLNGKNEIFSVDIVPSYSYLKNEFDEFTYKVPEVIKEKSHIIRKQLKWDSSLNNAWIISDPRGYIKIATETDRHSIEGKEFRKSVKIVKKWVRNLKDADKELKLKSFHIEQIITQYFQANNNLEIFDAIFHFFIKVPEILANPNMIRDRANNAKYIDDYIEKFTNEQITRIIEARDGFLVKLERLKEDDSIESLLEIIFYDRKGSEEFLFDSPIPTLTDSYIKFQIDGFVKPKKGLSSGWLRDTPQLQRGLTRGIHKRDIEFSIRKNSTKNTEYRWKVKNNDCVESRGEITLNQTKNVPESTEYVGEHYVECYAVQNGICIAKSKIIVKII